METNQQERKILKNQLFHDRNRTNVLKGIEQKAIAYFVHRIPKWVSSDMLTAIGFLGNAITMLSLILGKYLGVYWLLLSSVGLFVNWFGDSLDGRLAYFRNLPRKWYGFTLDLMVDWLGIILIGFGYMVYAQGPWEIAGYAFVVFYGWSTIIAIQRYKISGEYSIDSGSFGPTEVRFVLLAVIVLEVFVHNSILVTSTIICVLLFLFNLVDVFKLLKMANQKDKEENAAKSNKE